MISLKPLDESLLEWARVLHNDPEVLDVLNDPHVVSKEEQEKWFKKLNKSGSSERLVAFSETVPVGVVRFDSIDYYNKSICVGLDIHKDHRGKGLAKPIYRAIFKECFIDRQMHRVWLFVSGHNDRAKNLYSSLGFKFEGSQREAIIRGDKFYDSIMMSILRREYDEHTPV